VVVQQCYGGHLPEPDRSQPVFPIRRIRYHTQPLYAAEPRPAHKSIVTRSCLGVLLYANREALHPAFRFCRTPLVVVDRRSYEKKGERGTYVTNFGFAAFATHELPLTYVPVTVASTVGATYSSTASVLEPYTVSLALFTLSFSLRFFTALSCSLRSSLSILWYSLIPLNFILLLGGVNDFASDRTRRPVFFKYSMPARVTASVAIRYARETLMKLQIY